MITIIIFIKTKSKGVMSLRKKWFMFFVLAILLISLVGCNNESPTDADVKSDQEIRLKDTLGRKVVLEKPAEKVFLGFYFENFLAINGVDSLDKVVAMSKAEWSDFFHSQWLAYSKELPQLEKITDIGSIYTGTFSLEKAIATKADVAILAPFQFETLGEENVSKLEQQGTKVIVVDYNAQTVEKHVESTLIIGKIMGNEKRAKELADMYKEAVEDVEKRVAQANDSSKKVYIELGNKGAKEYGNSYGNYMWGNLVGLAGGDNIGKDKIETYGALNPEYVLSSNPEVIFFPGSHLAEDDGQRILMGFGVSEKDVNERVKPFTERSGWDKLVAVQKNEIYILDHSGLRSLYDFVFLQYIAKVLHPEEFEDVDPIKNHSEFYEKYLPIEAKGTFMIEYSE